MAESQPYRPLAAYLDNTNRDELFKFATESIDHIDPLSLTKMPLFKNDVDGIIALLGAGHFDAAVAATTNFDRGFFYDFVQTTNGTQHLNHFKYILHFLDKIDPTWSHPDLIDDTIYRKLLQTRY